MAELKTKLTKASVASFLAAIDDDQVGADCKRIATIMKKATGAKAEMWGSAIVGFGRYHYKGRSGREGDWMQVGFSPRKNNLTVYLTAGFQGHDALLAKLGKHSKGMGCLYMKRLSDVDVKTLEKLIVASVKRVRQLEREQAK